jgi:hypothetical protein
MIADAATLEPVERTVGRRQGRPFPLDAELVCDEGTRVALAIHRWLGPAPVEERRLLRRARGPVLDIGCGPRFPWATVGIDAGPRVAAASGFRLHGAWCRRGRWFAELAATGHRPSGTRWFT